MRLLNSSSLIVLGGGSHARVLLDALSAAGRFGDVVGILDPKFAEMEPQVLSVPVLGAEDDMAGRFPAKAVVLINGLGSTSSSKNRTRLFEKYRKKGYDFATILHPAAQIAKGVELGVGCQVMAGAVVQVGCSLGENVIINSGAIVDHDCAIGPHVHVAPGAVLSGGAVVGAGSHIGCGATVIQGVKIGIGVVVGAGAVVLADVRDGAVVVGVPAAEIT